MPENTISVARPTKFGNPYRVGDTQMRFPSIDGSQQWEHEGRLHKASGQRHEYYHSEGVWIKGVWVDRVTWHDVRDATVQECVDLFRADYASRLPLAQLAGKNLACWCPLDQPCHADVLLELANPTDP
jgi:hypothetical protein